jgi:hypothetical protein
MGSINVEYPEIILMDADAPDSFWRFIRLEQYARPQEPSQEKVRKGIFGLWHRLGGGKASGPSLGEKNLGQVPLELLDQVAPIPDWTEAVPAVTVALQNWLDAAPPENSVQLFVGPSYSGTAQILGHWARARGWRLVTAPEPEQILAGGDEWLAQIDDADEAPLVLTHLEHCYLRHYDGLTLLRRLLKTILSHRRRWLVACGSWAWVFFSRALRVNAVFPSPWVLAPFDQDSLQVWLPKAARISDWPDVIFRQSDNGKFIVPPAAESPESGQSDQTSLAGQSNFLKYLAAHSRGIPGIAWAIWRRSLYQAMEQEAEEKEADQEDGQTKATGGEKIIWVRPWHQLTWPSIPNQPERPQLLLVLHALMLHGGLWERIVQEILPFAPMESLEYLYLLEGSGLVELDQGFWRVTPAGYPAVRQELQSEGYLTDAI